MKSKQWVNDSIKGILEVWKVDVAKTLKNANF